MSAREADYWKERALQAEQALQAARSAAALPAERLAVIRALGDYKADEWVSTSMLANKLGWSKSRTWGALDRMLPAGWVRRSSLKVEGARGRPCRWRLGYMVVVPE